MEFWTNLLFGNLTVISFLALALGINKITWAPAVKISRNIFGKWSGLLDGDEDRFDEFAKMYVVLGINGFVVLNLLVIGLHYGLNYDL